MLRICEMAYFHRFFMLISVAFLLGSMKLHKVLIINVYTTIEIETDCESIVGLNLSSIYIFFNFHFGLLLMPRICSQLEINKETMYALDIPPF